MDRDMLLMKLPAFRDKKKLLVANQGTDDLINGVLLAHQKFAKDYDLIAASFVGLTDTDTFINLFEFCKDYVPYRAESKYEQLVKSPAAILETETGDCKTYALFIGGVLDSLKRHGAGFSVNYIFAKYKGSNVPAHVFVEVVSDGTAYWIDPVLNSFDSRDPSPTGVIRKKAMALYELSGVETPTDLAGGYAPPQKCLATYETVDQQLARLMPCSDAIQNVLVPTSDSPDIYELPNTSSLPTQPPVSATATDYTDPVTVQSTAPVTAAPTSDTAGTPPGSTSSGKNNYWIWLLVAGGLLAMSSRKK